MICKQLQMNANINPLPYKEKCEMSEISESM